MKTASWAPPESVTLRCSVGAANRVIWDSATISQFRRQPIVFGTTKLPVSFLKHADDQTVAAMGAVLGAAHAADWQERSFESWGVIAAPNLFGRISIAQTIQRYQQEGAWGISPQLIPHQSLHAMSGTISQALKIHGPNFGVGAEPTSGVDALLLAATLLYDGTLPGVWVVMTEFESEWLPDADGTPVSAPQCRALALALTPDSLASNMRLSFGMISAEQANEDLAILPEFQLGSLAQEPIDPRCLPEGRWRLGDHNWLESETLAVGTKE